MRHHDPLPAEKVPEVLSILSIGLWQWDTANDRITADAEAARQFDLPAEPVELRGAELRARIHPEDWNEMLGVVQLAVSENTLAEARIRVMDGGGRVLRTLRSRCRPSYNAQRDSYEVVGVIQEVSDPVPGATPQGPVIGDWRRNREAFLLDAGRALAEAESTHEVLRVAAGLSMPGFSPDGLAVFGVEGSRLTVVGHHGQPQQDAFPFTQMSVETDYPAAEVIRTGRAVYIRSPEEYRTRYPAGWPLAARFERRSWAFLPLVAGGRTLGAWMAGFAHPVKFTPDERSVLTTVARMLAQALARAGTVETERELTQGLQASMMPRLGPKVPGMEISGRYVPTGGGLQVGGDWFDMIPLPGSTAAPGTGGRFALVIGDVQGHDVQAAGLMGQLRIALRAYAAEGHPPDAVLSRASRFLQGINDSEGADDTRFATCLYVEVDPGSGALTIARAGHLDPGIRLADGTVLLRPTAGGLPLGIWPDADYPITEFVLDRGETLLLCTDGLAETGGHDLFTGWERVRDVLEGSSDAGDMEELADTLVSAVLGPASHLYTGPLPDRREDDIAFVLLHRPSESEESRAGQGAARWPVRRMAATVAQDEPDRIGDAREELRQLLHDWRDLDQIDSAVLLTSEMLANVLMHTDADATLLARVSGPEGSRRLRVEVTDSSDALPHRRDPGELASSGRGLFLIEQLASAWGVDPRGAGKTIWFELSEP
ncbi:SpoIIE family protein phosphatase [Streptomyces sp. UH6]|uniref:SpoIIE family protein phosphatase n=1 Tax=Streptomyces sp. UH6 TaxID=2748379 RepID=UPI0015D4A744|nr:SpoIIE family protein phosphatase [Streptomyces sp. UH6]NYV76140.1 SpoIIE family protein phosphatase [Streptomyces sp. UH6]